MGLWGSSTSVASFRSLFGRAPGAVRSGVGRPLQHPPVSRAGHDRRRGETWSVRLVDPIYNAQRERLVGHPVGVVKYMPTWPGPP